MWFGLVGPFWVGLASGCTSKGSGRGLGVAWVLLGVES